MASDDEPTKDYKFELGQIYVFHHFLGRSGTYAFYKCVKLTPKPRFVECPAERTCIFSDPLSSEDSTKPTEPEKRARNIPIRFLKSEDAWCIRFGYSRYRLEGPYNPSKEYRDWWLSG